MVSDERTDHYTPVTKENETDYGENERAKEMKKYCIEYENAGSGETHQVKQNNAHDAFIDLIDILDNISNHGVQLWIEN